MNQGIKKETRSERYDLFAKFLKISESKFEKLKNSNERYKEFDAYYSLLICPKGRHGALNDRLFEIFYGQRIFDSEKKMTSDLRVKEEILSENGTTLSFAMNDHGYVAIILYPTSTKYTKSIESAIFVANYVHPKKLLNDRFLKKQWNYFNSYMEYTSIDGLPSWTDKLRVNYLRYFKNLVVDDKYTTKKVTTFGISIFKYVLTVGLSGFLIYIFTIFPKKNIDKIHLDKNIQLEQINNNLKENLNRQKLILETLKSKDTTNI